MLAAILYRTYRPIARTLFLGALDADGFARAFAGARVGFGALTAHRQSATMADATIGLNFHQTLDVAVDEALEVAFDAIILLDDFAQTRGVGFGQIAHARIFLDFRFFDDLFGEGGADAEDVGESGFESLVAGQINASNTCHN